VTLGPVTALDGRCAAGAVQESALLGNTGHGAVILGGRQACDNLSVTRPGTCICPSRWSEWGRRWSWLSSSSCKLRGAMVMGKCGNSHVTTPPRLA
jgi:hypothetical protein